MPTSGWATFKRRFEMKEYVGRFPVNKALTAKLNVKNWVVYRDNELGSMYLLNTIVGEEIMTLYHNETAKGVSNETLDEWRADIEEKQAEWDKILENPVNPDLGCAFQSYYEILKREKKQRG